MSIIFVHTSLPVGGAECLRKTIATELLKRCIALRVCLLTGGGKIACELESSGVTVDSLHKSNSIYNPSTTRALKQYLDIHKPDIVQSSQFNSNFHARIAAHLAGVPVVICEEHGLYYWKRWYHRLVDRFLARWCDQVIAVSEAVKRFNVEQIGLSETKIQVLPNCLDTDRFNEIHDDSRDRIRAGLGIGPAEFVFGHVGTLRQEKGHDLLLTAFAELKKKHSAKLLLVGDGPLGSVLRDMADSLNIANDVLFCGSREDVPALLCTMDCFVFPSRNEALGIALLEAMYAGLPVIATAIGGIPEIVNSRKTGLLIATEDTRALYMAMEEIYENRTLRETLGTKAHHYVAQYHDPSRYADRLLRLHDKLLCKKA